MEKKFLPAFSLGLNMAVGMAVFSFLGIWADRKWGGENGWFTLAGIFLGLLYGGYEVWKIIKLNNDLDDQKKQ